MTFLVLLAGLLAVDDDGSTTSVDDYLRASSGRVAAAPHPEGLSAEFGRGVTFTSDDQRFGVSLRGRMQQRLSVRSTGDVQEPWDVSFLIRRARVVFLGHLFDKNIQFYIQLGFSNWDMEPDLRIPLRDAVLTWTAIRDLHVRVGQMKVPFNRQRVISSSALQFVDRSIVNAELNLDRDVGIQVFSNDLFGLNHVVGYQLGVFGGDGRNRIGENAGLLYVGRLQFQPFGRFDDDYSEADLTREERVRLSVGAGAGYNQRTRRLLSTHGGFFPEGSYDQLHAQFDLMLKYAGFSLQSEVLFREAQSAPRTVRVGDDDVLELSRSGLGYMVQLGYVTPCFIELGARWAEILPWARVSTALVHTREVGAVLGWYILEHNLKIQADYAFRFFAPAWSGNHEARVQMQLFF